MQQYLDLVRHVLEKGTRKENRTGVDTISTFGYFYEHDLRDGFPLLTTKAVSWKNIVVELLWFLSGQTDISILARHGCRFWDPWVDPVTGRVPSAYGAFWRNFPVHDPDITIENEWEEAPSSLPLGRYNDQIAWVLAELRRNPMSRRMVVSAWASGNAQTSKLPPCHAMWMLNVQNFFAKESVQFMESRPDFAAQGLPSFVPMLCLHLTQRSCDVFLGVPYNIASYALLLSLFARFADIEPGIFAHSLVDAHIYTSKPDGSMAEYDHVPALQEQLSREPRPLPKLHISDEIRDLADVERLMHPSVTTEEVMRHFVLEGYNPWPALKGKVAV